MEFIEKAKQEIKVYTHQFNFRKRITMSFFSVILMGFGISLFAYSNMGVDPYTCLNMSLSSLLHMQFGLWQMIMNAAILAVAFALSKKLVGLGTIFNMVLVGFTCDFFTNLYEIILPHSHFWLTDLIFMCLGVVLLSLSASLFFTAGLGYGPYDCLAFLLDDHSPIKFKWCRVITDIICVAIGFSLGGTVGVGTVVTAFCMGPLVQFFNVEVSEKILDFDLHRSPVFRPVFSYLRVLFPRRSEIG